jgi:hypothetical protein
MFGSLGICGKKLIGIVGGWGGVQLGPLGIAATNRPIVPFRVIMTMEKLVE